MTTLEVAALRPRLPRVDAGEASRGAALRLGLSGRVVDGGLHLRVRLDGAPASGPVLRFKGGVSAALTRVNGRPALWLDAPASAVLPEALAEFSALEPLLAAVEAALGVALDPLGVEPGFGAGLLAQVEARDGAGHVVHAMTLGLGPEVALAPTRPTGEPVLLGLAASARTPVRIELEGPLAPAAELARLAVGDVVLASGGGGGMRARLSAANGRIWRGVWRPGDGRFTGDGMNDANEAAPTEGGPLSAPGNLPVRLSFELSGVEVTLAEVAALAPGAVLATPSAGDSPAVTITAGGARLARGRLVALGDGYGVVIDEVAEGGAEMGPEMGTGR